MKKLSLYFKFLVNFLLVSLVATLLSKIWTVAKMILLNFGLIDNSPKLENNNFLLLTGIVSILVLIYMFWLILKFRKTIYETGTNSFFSEKNEQVFRSIGKGLVHYSAIIFVIRVVEKYFDKLIVGESAAYNLGRNFGVSVRESIPLLVIALFLLIIAQLIKDGYELKNENDLTI